MRRRSMLVAAAMIAATLIPPAGANPTASGRNGRIVFSRGGDIFSIRPDGTQRVRLTRSATSEGDAQWAPDGTSIFFIRYLNEEPWSALYVMRADGSGKRKVSGAFEGSIQHPEWSPDGTMIAYTDLDISNPDAAAPYPAAIHVIDVAASTDVALTTMDSISAVPDWSPDSSQILFISARDGDEDIWVMDSDGTDPVKLLDSPVHEFDPAWSPDGTKIAFSQPAGPGSQANRVLHVMDADGSNVEAVADGSRDDQFPLWSPDSTRLLVTRTDDRFRDEQWVVDPDGSGLTDVSGPGLRAFGYPAGVWSPNSAKVVFTAGGDLYIRRLDGGIRGLTSTKADEFLGSWQAR
jgi:Tol biopolymer transport system component